MRQPNTSLASFSKRAPGRAPPLWSRLAVLPTCREHCLEPNFHTGMLAYLQFSRPLRGVSVAVSSHLRVTLVYVSHLRLVGEPHTVGCLPMCCPLIHCMAASIAKMSYAWRASRRDLRDPGRGDPGFWRC